VSTQSPTAAGRYGLGGAPPRRNGPCDRGRGARARRAGLARARARLPRARAAARGRCLARGCSSRVGDRPRAPTTDSCGQNYRAPGETRRVTRECSRLEPSHVAEQGWRSPQTHRDVRGRGHCDRGSRHPRLAVVVALHGRSAEHRAAPRPHSHPERGRCGRRPARLEGWRRAGDEDTTFAQYAGGHGCDGEDSEGGLRNDSSSRGRPSREACESSGGAGRGGRAVGPSGHEASDRTPVRAGCRAAGDLAAAAHMGSDCQRSGLPSEALPGEADAPRRRLTRAEGDTCRHLAIRGSPGRPHAWDLRVVRLAHPTSSAPSGATSAQGELVHRGPSGPSALSDRRWVTDGS